MLDLIWYCLGTFLLTALLVGGSITFYCCLDKKKLKSRLNHKKDNGLDEIDYHRVLTRDQMPSSELDSERPATYFVPRGLTTTSSFRATEVRPMA
uniref:Putative secreted protein n=1 Tax=Xenopsylla cheopis TaxID=163159 RepID=A0A6M2E3C8_XENCH